jgi:glycosyltransferase involved in cell wall biosynthesis
MNTVKADSHPLVSAVIPVYNCERYLAEAVRSVLAQTYTPIEIVVVDDGSTDRSAEVARSFSEVQYYRMPSRGGIGPARNLGVEHVRGHLLAFLDADDLWPTDKTELQIAAMTEDPSRDMVFGQVEQFRSPDLPAVPGSEASFPTMYGHFASSMLIETASFLRAGRFASAFRVGEFIDWYARAQDAGLNSYELPRVVLRRRIHETNTGIRDRGARGDYARALQAVLSRRRALGQTLLQGKQGEVVCG